MMFVLWRDVILVFEHRGLFCGVCLRQSQTQTDRSTSGRWVIAASANLTHEFNYAERERETTGKCVYAETNAWLLQIWGDDFSSKQMNAGHVIIYWTDTLKCSVALWGLWFLNRRDVPGLCTSPRGVKSSRVETWLRDARVRCRAAAPSPGHKTGDLARFIASTYLKLLSNYKKPFYLL